MVKTVPFLQSRTCKWLTYNGSLIDKVVFQQPARARAAAATKAYAHGRAGV